MTKDNNIKRSLDVFCVVVLMTVLLFLSGCREDSFQTAGQNEESKFIQINNFKIPVFSTIEEQLNYTKSGFIDIQQHRASLQAFIKLYPEEKRYRGLAGLDLAYTELGSDYRFAYTYSQFAAIKSYNAILEDYGEFPDIMAKAHWYVGWIYSDLLHDNKKGVAEFQKIVRQYGEQRLSLSSPAPWVSIISQTDEETKTNKTAPLKNYWAAMALVEIIRNTDSEDTAIVAFEKLWHGYGESNAAGFGLKLMLERRFRVNEILEIARRYMEKEFSNVHLLGDIQQEIDDITGVIGGWGQ